MLLDFCGDCRASMERGCNLFPDPVVLQHCRIFYFCFSLCKAIRKSLFISVCFCLPCKASRMSLSVLWFSFKPMKVVFSFIHFFLASLSGTVDNVLPSWYYTLTKGSGELPKARGNDHTVTAHPICLMYLWMTASRCDRGAVILVLR